MRVTVGGDVTLCSLVRLFQTLRRRQLPPSSSLSPSTLRMEALFSSETSVDFYWIRDLTLQTIVSFRLDDTGYISRIEPCKTET
jgi:hypothetical protein